MEDRSDSGISVFYYNPNIYPAEEEQRRFSELKKYLEQRYDGQIGIIRGKYDAENWRSFIEPLEMSGEGGMRCRFCYYLRLLETFKMASQTGASSVTSTLSISPYKNFDWLDETGKLLSLKFKIEWFLEKWDYKRSIGLSKEYGLYRQKYCGCEFSMNERLNILKRKGS